MKPIRLLNSISIQVTPMLIVLSALITNINSQFYIAEQNSKNNIAYLLAIFLVVLLAGMFFRNKPRDFFFSLVEVFYDLGVRFILFGGIGIGIALITTLLGNPSYNTNLETSGKFLFGPEGMMVASKYYSILYPVFAVGLIMLVIGVILKLLKFFKVINIQKKVTANKTVVKQILTQRQRVNKYYQAKDFQSKYDSNVINFALPDDNSMQIDYLKASELEKRLSAIKENDKID
jgi:hypothetical protein